jgi:hypothetical protein
MTARRTLPTVHVERSRDMAQPVDPLTTPPRPRGGWELALHIITREIRNIDLLLFALVIIVGGGSFAIIAALAANGSN